MFFPADRLHRKRSGPCHSSGMYEAFWCFRLHPRVRERTSCQPFNPYHRAEPGPWTMNGCLIGDSAGRRRESFLLLWRLRFRYKKTPTQSSTTISTMPSRSVTMTPSKFACQVWQPVSYGSIFHLTSEEVSGSFYTVKCVMYPYHPSFFSI